MTNPDLDKAIAILQAGGLVAFPTETVYGLGADAMHETAIRRIFQVKARPYDHPLIVHLADISQLSAWAREIPSSAYQLAEACWPGPLTIILKKQPQVLDIVTGGQDTVGLRIPRHPLALALLKAFGRGVVAPSANQFTHISPTTAAAVREELGASVDLILDGGDCTVGLESTIIDLSGEQARILRPGMINAAMLTALLGQAVTYGRQDTPQPKVPGTHHLHYAPLTATQLLAKQELVEFVTNLPSTALPIAIVVRDTSLKHGLEQEAGRVCVELPNDPTAYAHDLYHTLRTLDQQKFKRIIIEDVPESDEWTAIRDRLNKASGTR